MGYFLRNNSFQSPFPLVFHFYSTDITPYIPPIAIAIDIDIDIALALVIGIALALASALALFLIDVFMGM